MKILLIYSSFFLLFASVSAAQSIKGAVHDHHGNAIPFANVLLLSHKDSVMLKTATASDSGEFVLENVQHGTYRLMTSAVGYQKAYTDTFSLQNKPGLVLTKNLVMNQEDNLLEQVTIKGSRPVFEQETDKLVVNVQAMLTGAGGNALDVLERSPGVVINRQSNALSLLGKSGVTILINGKTSRITPDAIMQMLQGMHASNIEKIELISNPPARYDAEGDAGIINIILKKDSNAGMNGSCYISAGMGRYEKFNGGINLNYRNKKWNIFSDYAAVRDREWQQLKTYSDLMFDGQFTRNRTVKNLHNTRPFQSIRTGVDYNISNKTTVGVLLSGFWNGLRSYAPGKQDIYRTEQLTQEVSFLDEEKNFWKHGMANVYLVQKFKKNQELTVDVDFVKYHNSNPHAYTNRYYEPNKTMGRTELIRIRKETPIRIWVMKAEYNIDLNPGTKLNFGSKATFMKLNNDVHVEYDRPEGWEANPEFTRNFDLQDKIAAGFVNLNHKFNSKFHLQAGLRYEFAHMLIGQPGQSSMVDRRYSNLFPSIFVTHELSKTSSLNISCSRRVQRPGYDLLAPWVMFINPYTFVSGNPELLPAFTHIIQSTYSFKSRYLLAVKFSHDRNALDRFRTHVDSTTNRTLITAENIRSLGTVSAMFSAPVTISSWWKMQTNITGVYQKIKTDTEGKLIHINNFNANIFNSHTITFPAGFTAELSALYNSASFWGISKMKALGSVNIGVKKKLAKNKGSITMNVSDLFRTNTLKLAANNVGENQVSGWSQRYEARVMRLTYSRTFGNSFLKGNGQRSTGSEEERTRVSAQ